ncbi:unnamed protein product, partial [marine sediment metagenome]
MAELNEIKFLGRITKLHTASVRVIIYHYIENDRYRLKLTNREVSLKIAKQSYMAALGGLEERRLVITVRDGKIVLIEPDPGYKPIPRYDVKRNHFLNIISKNENIDEIVQSLKMLPYRKKMYGTTHYDAKTLVEEWVNVEKRDCGCCSRLDLHKRAQETLLGWWMLFKSNLSLEENFRTTLTEEDVLKVT